MKYSHNRLHHIIFILLSEKIKVKCLKTLKIARIFTAQMLKSVKE
jgi:hypothetical protein